MLQDSKTRKTLDSFINSEALSINNARLESLAKLPLIFQNKSVLEIGAGPGLLTDFFLRRGAGVTVTDGRIENIRIAEKIVESTSESFAQIKMLDLENLDSISDQLRSSNYDLIFAFGILYHLSQPERVINELSKRCNSMFLLETIVSSYDGDSSIVDERPDFNQAINGRGSRLSFLSYLSFLEENFDFVYFPEQPIHQEYLKFSLGHYPSRIFLVASKQNIPTLQNFKVGKDGAVTLGDK